MLANYLKKPKDGTIRLSIFKGQQRIFFKNYPANKAADNRFYSFVIEQENTPIIQAGNYRLQLRYFPHQSTDKLAVWIHKKEIYPYGQLFLNKKKHEGDMTFRVYYRSTIWESRSLWLNSDPQPSIRAYLILVSLILLILVLNYFFYYLIDLLWKKL
jgi:hypothetical protein